MGLHQVLGKSKTEVSRISIINEETGHLVEDHVLLMSLIVTTLMLEINCVRTLVFHGKRVTISLITSRFSFASVSREDVTKLIKGMKVHKASAVEELSSKLLRDALGSFIDELINSSV